MECWELEFNVTTVDVDIYQIKAEVAGGIIIEIVVILGSTHEAAAEVIQVSGKEAPAAARR